MPNKNEIEWAMAAYRKSSVENDHEGPDERAITAALEAAESWRRAHEVRISDARLRELIMDGRITINDSRLIIGLLPIESENAESKP